MGPQTCELVAFPCESGFRGEIRYSPLSCFLARQASELKSSAMCEPIVELVRPCLLRPRPRR
eukprot:15454183-Alexandrium_andersonii.AAC.1